jgi:hypothetical protein
MIKNIFVATILLTFAVCATRLWADDTIGNPNTDTIKEGQWEITTAMNANPESKSTQKDVITRCVTNANPIPDIHEFAKNFEGCIEPQVRKKGTTVDYNISCSSDAGQISLNGHVVFTGDTMQGDASIQTMVKGKANSVQTYITGKYVGTC